MTRVDTAVWADAQIAELRTAELALATRAVPEPGYQHPLARRFTHREQPVAHLGRPAETCKHAGDVEFGLGEYLHKNGKTEDAIAHFKEAQRLDPDNWNYKRQAWALSDAEKNYGTSFMKEVQKLNGKPYYAPRKLPDVKKR